jgi:hypothetical protein
MPVSGCDKKQALGKRAAKFSSKGCKLERRPQDVFESGLRTVVERLLAYGLAASLVRCSIAPARASIWGFLPNLLAVKVMRMRDKLIPEGSP